MRATASDYSLVERNPFDLLKLPPHANLDSARASYRALARKHHPDTAPESGKERATRAMAELNWAMEELERDLEGWRRLSDGSAIDALFAVWERRQEPALTVEPRLVLLNRTNGFEGWVTAAAPGVASQDVKMRYSSELIAVERAHSVAGVMNFWVHLAPDARELAAEQSESLEITVPGGAPVSVRVAVAPFTADESQLWQRDYSQPFRYTRELFIAGAAFLGALGIVALVVA